jgi:hypothetical protein
MLKSAVAPQAEPVNNVRSAKQPAHGAFDNTPRMVMQRQQLLALAPTAPQGQAVVQRMKLYVRTKDGGRAVHINEYHFASLMAQASISSSASGGAHSVVLRPFDDFNGLALAAEAHTADNSGFEFGGITWGWNGANELFPVADGNACVDVPGEFFDELISQARDPGKVTQNLANNKAATAVYKALPKKGNDEDDSSGGATEGAIISMWCSTKAKRAPGSFMPKAWIKTAITCTCSLTTASCPAPRSPACA